MDGGAVDPVTTRQTPSSPVVAIAFTRYCCCCCLSVLRTSHPNPNPNPNPNPSGGADHHVQRRPT